MLFSIPVLVREQAGATVWSLRFEGSVTVSPGRVLLSLCGRKDWLSVFWLLGIVYRGWAALPGAQRPETGDKLAGGWGSVRERACLLGESGASEPAALNPSTRPLCEITRLYV